MADHLSSPEALLAWLGESQSADEVADKLRSLGVKGRCVRPSNCVLARAFHLAGDPTATTDGDNVWIRGDVVRLPRVVGLFTLHFDLHRYPELIEAS